MNLFENKTVFSKLRSFRICSLAVLGFGSLLSVSPTGAESTGAVLWEADFSQLEPGSPVEYGKGLAIKEEGGVKFLSKSNSETEFVFSTEAQKAGGAKWNNYVFRVKYRELEKSTITLVVKARGERSEAAYMQYYVSIREKSLGLLCHGLPKEEFVDDPRREAVIKFEDIGAAPLPVGEWITAEVTVGEEVIRVSVDAGDQQPRVAEFKAFPGGGSVSVLARSPLDIQSATVRAAGETFVGKPAK